MTDRPVARCQGPSTRDIILADAMPPPTGFIAESYEHLGNDDVSFSAYTSEDFARRERERLWPQAWQMACRQEEIPNPRDFLVYDIGDDSAIVVRQDDGSVRGFVNSCIHRGMQLAASGSRGHAGLLRCPFHGWSYAPDGALKALPCAWDFAHVDRAAARLDEIATASWGGFVFVHFGDDPPALDEYLSPVAELDLPVPMAGRHIAAHYRKHLPANWKIALEAFLEAYHVVATHPEGLPTAGDANCQYDLLGDHVSRFIHTIGFQSPHLTGTPSEEDLLARLDRGLLGLRLEPGQRARDVFAAHLRTTLGAQHGIDLAGISTTQMIDSIEYFCFPNFVFFPGIALPMVYRFLPDPASVDRCYFDLWFLAPTRPGERPPPVPPSVELALDEPFATAPGIDPKLAYIYDQDVDNLARLTKGIKASRKPGQTLGTYQEVRIRHMRQTLARYLGED